MKLPRRITATWLKENGACDVDGFRKLFPRGAAVTVANAKKAIDAGLDVRWLIERLPRSARAEYDKARAAALAEYNKATVPAWAEYDKATAAALAEYDKARAAALAEYNKATTTALVKIWDKWSKE